MVRSAETKKMLMYKSVLVVIVAVACVQGKVVHKEDIKYYIYTADSPNDPIEITTEAEPDDSFSPEPLVKILCHGYQDTYNSYWVKPTKNAYMRIGQSNIISVDWSKHAYGTYTQAHISAKSIGSIVAELIISISEKHQVPLGNFHLIGHSLGAHILGFAGKKILQEMGQKVGRITGLDPAGPDFIKRDADDRLNFNDATFVDAIHTDTSLLGFNNSLAHADFWPNGGAVQNGCFILSTCSHLRAPLYFYESIGNDNFPAWQCETFKYFKDGKCFSNHKALMGDGCESNARGDYYLSTKKESPFGIKTY